MEREVRLRAGVLSFAGDGTLLMAYVSGDFGDAVAEGSDMKRQDGDMALRGGVMATSPLRRP